MRRNFCALALVSVTVLLCGPIAANAAASSTTGSPQAIAFLRGADAAYRRFAGVTETVWGMVSMQSLLGEQSSFAWAWGLGYVPQGYTPATEHITIQLRHGLMVWGEDQLTPSCLHSSAGCIDLPVRVFVDHAGAFWAFNDPRASATVTCFNRLKYTETPIGRVGHAWLNGPLGVDFLPLIRRRSEVLLRYSYPWANPHQRALEIDTYTASKRLVAYRISVSRGPGSAHPAFSFSGRVGTLAHAPLRPTVRMCG
jgi:hypothetical protein